MQFSAKPVAALTKRLFGRQMQVALGATHKPAKLPVGLLAFSSTPQQQVDKSDQQGNKNESNQHNGYGKSKMRVAFEVVGACRQSRVVFAIRQESLQYRRHPIDTRTNEAL